MSAIGNKSINELETAYEIRQFFRRVDRSEECWLWMGSKDRGGYGVTWHRGARKLAHRVAMVLEWGDVPAGMFVCHSCDNPSCVNPDHLFFGSPQDNRADCVGKGRQARGEGGANKLTEGEVMAIIDNKEGLSNRDLGEKYGVTFGCIGYIRRGETWKHLHGT